MIIRFSFIFILSITIIIFSCRPPVPPIKQPTVNPTLPPIQEPTPGESPMPTPTLPDGCGTLINSGVIANETWILSGSPYCVQGDIQVSLLTIESGVKVLVDGSYEIEVLSTIRTNGTQTNPVIFSVLSPDEPYNQRWEGFKFQNTPQGSEFNHTIIEYSINGAVNLFDSSGIIFNNCTFRNNNKNGPGGGFNVQGVISGDIDVTGCTFSNNSSTKSAGAILVNMEGDYTINIVDTIFENNTANLQQSLGNYSGGAMYLQNGNANIENSLFSHNICNSYGPQVFARGGSIFIQVPENDNVVIKNCVICENITKAITTKTGGTCHSLDYTRSFGGGVYVNSGTVSIFNSIISGNTTTRTGSCHATNEGSGLYINDGSIKIENSTIARNFNAAGITIAQGDINIVNSIIFFNYNNGIQIKGNALVTYSNIQGGYTGTGNINFNPVFSGTGNEANDFKLIIGSPSIDAGNPNSEYNDACFPPSHNTFINDMGAYGGPLGCNW